jgi:uncharacterized Zn-finger protein
MSDSIDHVATSEPVCPHCGDEFFDAWELFYPDKGDTEEVDCEACNKPYKITVEYTATYTTEAINTNNEETKDE